ncbi:MAG: WecB/TagA/CpsF family glycosyltransferase, partial [Candidatus Levyibacteriota bacterium]
VISYPLIVKLIINMEELEFIKLFGVKITTANEESILKYILKTIDNKGKKLFITTPNPEIIMYGNSHPEFKKILNEADLALPDGIGVSLCAWLTGKGYVHRITGVDMVEKVCSALSKSADSAGFFGGLPGVAEDTAKCLQKKYYGLTVNYASDVWDTEKMTGKKIGVLFVAMGYPAQEKWIHENLDKIPVRVAIGVGGAFDFISGNTSRAPKLLRMIGLEWLYRLVIQPWRWRRQLALIKFSLMTLKEALHL